MSLRHARFRFPLWTESLEDRSCPTTAPTFELVIEPGTPLAGEPISGVIRTRTDEAGRRPGGQVLIDLGTAGQVTTTLSNSDYNSLLVPPKPGDENVIDVNGEPRVLASGAAVDLPALPAGTNLVRVRYGGDGYFPAADYSFVLPVTAPRAGREFWAVGAAAGNGPVVRVERDDESGGPFQTFAYDPGFTGGVRVAVGDVTGDGYPDVVTGPGPGMGPLVRVLDGRDGTVVREVLAFEAGFTGGVNVACADLTGDGRAEVIVAADNGGGPRVRVLDGIDFAVRADFLAIEDPNFRGGARVGVGDVNADGVPDLLVGAGFGGGPRVAVYDGAALGPDGGPKLFADFFAFESSLRDGVYLAAGETNGDGVADLAVGAGPGGAPRVVVFNGADLLTGAGDQAGRLVDEFAGDPNNRSGAPIGTYTNPLGELTIAAAEGDLAGTVWGFPRKELLMADGGAGFAGFSVGSVGGTGYALSRAFVVQPEAEIILEPTAVDDPSAPDGGGSLFDLPYYESEIDWYALGDWYWPTATYSLGGRPFTWSVITPEYSNSPYAGRLPDPVTLQQAAIARGVRPPGQSGSGGLTVTRVQPPPPRPAGLQQRADGWRLLNVDTRVERPRSDASGCGPDAAARVIRYYGWPLTFNRAVQAAPDSIDSWLIQKLGMGTKPGTLASLLRRYGVSGAQAYERTSFQSILNALNAGRPVIALINWSNSITDFHHVVVQGYNPQTRQLAVNDGGDLRAWSYSYFQRLWDWDTGWLGNFLIGDIGGLDPRTIVV
jgi:hypothetical protein